MARIKNFEQVAKKIKKAYELSMRNNTMRYVVCLDSESEQAYIFEDVAGGNSEPESVWSGKDFLISEFCHQYWEPGDGDEMYLQNLLSHTNLSDKQQIEIIRKVDQGELTMNEIKGTYPDAVDEYNNEYISNEMAEFDPNCYIERFESEL